ncbi:ATP12 family chaperone protein [Magnetospirillum molischianum]|uniref:Chaperone required for the assembly of the mitochondrial F1-ATPase n=1 Tax=Magnetospirillum molischianum DSM 120 TaxID=1150626 RepID=H8FRS1_MAGML|nr:ATP12 family protein [Magnetospirillum molischianum]CCG41059.1 Chaperone required for the assembly of the mitochondrial F1-ATPase [Magnetospirillum molischianum DSM 120]
MSLSTLRRFYEAASAAESEGGFAVHLDGRPVRTPGGRFLLVPARPLAEAVAAEWDAQVETILPSTMPLTQLSSTALDRVAPERETITGYLMAYAGTDLLCYRAEAPADLAMRQSREWQPLLDWAAETLAAPLASTVSVLAVSQPDHALAALATHLDAQDSWRLTAIQAAAAATGSLILALALAEERIDAEAAWSLSQLDETYQIEQWGEDAEATSRRAALKRDIAAAERLLSLLKA